MPAPTENTGLAAPENASSTESKPKQKYTKASKRLSQMFDEENAAAKRKTLSQMGIGLSSAAAAVQAENLDGSLARQTSGESSAPMSRQTTGGSISGNVKRKLSRNAEMARVVVSERFHEKEKASIARYWRLVVATALGSATLSFVIDEYTFQYGTVRSMWTNIQSGNDLFMITIANIAAVVFARLLVRQCVEAEGSGFPDMKAMIFGKVMNNYLTGKVLAIKAIALGLVVGAGMPAGKEGPNVHMAACISRMIAPGYFTENLEAGTSRGRSAVNSILLAACAVGVAASFSSPIGGVIFTVEFMLPQLFDRTTYWGCFVASVSGSLCYAAWRSATAGAGTLEELISTNVKAGIGATAAWPVSRAMLDVTLGCLCGLLAGAWINMHTWTNKKLKQWRTKVPSPPSAAAVPLLEADGSAAKPSRLKTYWQQFQWRDLWICTVIVVLNTLWAAALPLLNGKPQPRIISDLFDKTLIDKSHAWSVGPLGPVGTMLLCFVMKWVTTILTLAMAMPTGVVAPTMIIGALIGRCFVMVCVPKIVADTILGTSPDAADYDDIYSSFMARFAIVGAAAFCAGVTRCFAMAITIFECIALPNAVLPLCMSTLASIFVANKVALPFFDCNLVGRGLGGIPFLSSTDHALKPVYEVMRRIDLSKDCLQRKTTPQVVRSMLTSSRQKHFAIIEYLPDTVDAMLCGHMTRESLENFARLYARVGVEKDQEALLEYDLLDPQFQVSSKGSPPLVDTCPMHVDHSLTVKDVYIALKITNPKEHVYVTQQGRLLGQIDFQDLIVQKV